MEAISIGNSSLLIFLQHQLSLTQSNSHLSLMQTCPRVCIKLRCSLVDSVYSTPLARLQFTSDLQTLNFISHGLRMQLKAEVLLDFVTHKELFYFIFFKCVFIRNFQTIFSFVFVSNSGLGLLETKGSAIYRKTSCVLVWNSVWTCLKSGSNSFWNLAWDSRVLKPRQPFWGTGLVLRDEHGGCTCVWDSVAFSYLHGHNVEAPWDSEFKYKRIQHRLATFRATILKHPFTSFQLQWNHSLNIKHIGGS